jgi:hypothetical protein
MNPSLRLVIQSFAFERALNTLKHQSLCLDEYLEAEMKKLNTIEELQDLADQLPKGYRGTVRVLEKIEKLK